MPSRAGVSSRCTKPGRRGSAGLRRLRDAGQQAALAELGQQPREPRRARRAGTPLGLAHEVGQGAPPVDQLEQLRVGVRQPHEAVG